MQRYNGTTGVTEQLNSGVTEQRFSGITEQRRNGATEQRVSGIYVKISIMHYEINDLQTARRGM